MRAEITYRYLCYLLFCPLINYESVHNIKSTISIAFANHWSIIQNSLLLQGSPASWNIWHQDDSLVHRLFPYTESAVLFVVVVVFQQSFTFLSLFFFFSPLFLYNLDFVLSPLLLLAAFNECTSRAAKEATVIYNSLAWTGMTLSKTLSPAFSSSAIVMGVVFIQNIFSLPPPPGIYITRLLWVTLMCLGGNKSKIFFLFGWMCSFIYSYLCMYISKWQASGHMGRCRCGSWQL